MRRSLARVSDARDGTPRAGAYRRKGARALSLVPPLLAGALLTACSGGSGGSSAAGSGGAEPTGANRAVAFAKCMRENGVEKFPDPSGGGAMISKDSGIDVESPEFKKAQEACKDLSPQNEAAKSGRPADLAKARIWAECIRDNGVKEFPDPAIDGNTAVVDVSALNNGEADADRLDKALEACKSKRPSGNLAMRGNGGGR
ncbi:hypothetical protein ACIBI3_06700 [Actinomadura luteofluorescens]|uniref:hypothetical protein n=1 Tax=Actinomadura luteofluorescens TaxID=46163 RepID=UPI003494FCF2